ncbi:uncharacterized protein [Centruroides vittatus]|uniref:uncharacterized protein n=1 Tax=Centruroides vittatus TaxID=120091 RepID=UPI00350F7008
MLMEVIMDGVREESPWTMLYADDIVLCAETKEELRVKLERWLGTLEGRGLRVSRSKTVYMCSGKVDGARERDLELRGDVFRKVNTFKYLGSTVAEDGGVDKEVTGRIQAGWRNWRDMSGVLCDKRVPLRLKGKVYRVVVRPAMLYAIETVSLRKTHVKRMEVAEMRMLRWMCGVTRRDHIRNECVRGTVKVTNIEAKIQEARLKWFGHVVRREEEYVGRRVMQMSVRGRRRRGRPRRRWMDLVAEDLRGKHLNVEAAQDREQWRRLIRNSDPT